MHTTQSALLRDLGLNLSRIPQEKIFDPIIHQRLEALVGKLKYYTDGHLDEMPISLAYRCQSLLFLIRHIKHPGSLIPELGAYHRACFMIDFIAELNYLVSQRILGIYHNLDVLDGTHSLRQTRDALAPKKG